MWPRRARPRRSALTRRRWRRTLVPATRRFWSLGLPGRRPRWRGSIDDGGTMSTPTFNPLAPIGRTWRRLRRRPRAMQIRTVLMILAVVVGLVLWIVMAPSGAPGSAQGAGASEVPAAAAAPTVTPVSQASTSTRGVSAHGINVVFPVISLSSIAGRLGLSEDKEY